MTHRMTDDVQGIRGTLRESALRCAGLALVLRWRDTLPLSAAPALHWRRTLPLSAALALHWRRTLPLSAAPALHWRRTLSLSAAVRCTTKDLQNNLNRV